MSETKIKKNALSWKISPEDLKKQVEEYDTLKFKESYRGQSVLFMIFILALTVAYSFFGDVINISDVLFGLILYIPILIFTYKGHRWAIVALMILWTIDKIFTASMGHVISSAAWWIVSMPIFMKALRIENERLRIRKSKQVDSTVPVKDIVSQ